MEKEELDNLINSLEQNASKDKASFGLFFHDGEDEMHLRANKDGFELFAAKLLKASRDAESVINNSEKNYIPLDIKEKWIQGEIITYIKPVAEDRENIEDEKPYVTTFKDDVFKFGCLLILAILGLSIIVGIYTVVNWFV